MELRTLLSYLHHLGTYVGENPTVTSIEMDSRKVTKGALFICIKGFTVDGHDFAQQAVENGAVAIIAEREVDVSVPVILVRDSKRALAVLADAFYGQPTHKLHLIGVTGTNGKTTTTHLIDYVFRKARKKTGLIGTMHIKIGDKTYDVKNTTPDALVLQRTFKQMVEEEIDTAIMEVSSHALHMGRVHGCDYDIAVFTNLTQDHLDYHRTMEEYRLAKGLLFAQLGNRFDHQRPKFAILNQDDPSSEYYKHMTAATVITYGIDQDSDIMAKQIEMSPNGMKFDLVTPDETVRICTKLIGRFNVYNILAAASACLASGLSLSTIAEALEEISGVSGRFETVNEGQDFTVIVDYAHTPDSLENVLKTIRQFAKRNIYVVVGCGGDRDRAKRPLMAQIAVKYADTAIFTSDNPRSERPEDILHDMEKGVAGKRYISIADRKAAIRYAVEHAQKDDVILIAGKGHETYQIIGNQVLHFDDRIVAREAIKERNGEC
ncbi:UDP-N-acetylmuramoyl-L-alanyl-D-glutamate--2,6-diaminopimelate ligase [Anoxybacteroides rupiense]|uniref:UDP-N-acetylmuramoyl-L-alanyl-D-glutamate--2, 6-diaminopimelate ligase n=1 Tax=Anoxybacteroides rupiense TaxID=311460 RepID=UPI001F088FD2|nr:UDP-N-acetylmuramoyl-L-alanyl-D-glutamate--2,6-diaminopimelate ligase [Anoxybacillus rupiensis]